MVMIGPSEVATHVQGPTLAKARQIIADLQTLNRAATDVASLKEKLGPIFKGFRTKGMAFEAGVPLYRGNVYLEQPQNRSRLSYPPNNLVTKVQRANRPGQPMFYCSGARQPPFFEIDVKPGKFISLSRWRTKERLFVNNIGYHDAVFERLNSTRAADFYPGIMPALDPEFPDDEVNALIRDFLAEEFSIKVAAGNEDRYKLSAAISERLLGNVTDGRDDRRRASGPVIPACTKMAGIMYPSIAMACNADNFALVPDFVDEHLILEQVEYLRIDAIREPLKYEYTPIDFANSFESDGKINWFGRVQKWTFQNNQGVTATEEAGEVIFRDRDGKVVSPT